MKKYILLTLLLGSIFLSENANATHIVGAEIRYQCLGGNQYHIVLDVYRDCGPGNELFDSTAYVQAFDDNYNYISNLNLNMVFQGAQTIPNNISEDPCLLPPDSICVEFSRYEKTVTINQPGGIYIVYQRCCRNEGIINIQNPVQTGSTYYVYLSPESRALCNSSPEFGFYPPIYVCVGKDLNHNHMATDIDGDSLAYKFYTPFIGATEAYSQPTPGDASPPPYDNDTVVWVEPLYNLDSLLGPSTVQELEIDPVTGMISGRPEIQGQFVVGVMVEEYRNGLLLSRVRRDFQYNVGECVQVDAEIGAPIAQCDDLTVQFQNFTDGPNSFLWYFEWPDTTIFSTDKEPAHTYPDTGTYTVILTAAPGYDCVDTDTVEIFLQYNSLTTDFEWQTFDCSDESVLVLTDASVDDVSPPIEWNWEVIYGTDTLISTAQNPVFEVPNPANGTISLTVLTENGCEQMKTVEFETGGNNPIDSLQSLIQICIGETAELNPFGPTFGFSYEWGFPVPPDQQHSVNPMVMPLITTTYSVTITGYNDLCVSDAAEVTVEVSPAVSLDFEEDTQCNALEVDFINHSQNAAQGYVWDFGDPATTDDTSTQSDPTYTYPEYSSYTVTLATAPNAICKDTISREITIEEKILEAAFGFDYSDCEEDALAIEFFDETTNNLDNTVQWLWAFSGIFNGTSDQPSPTIVVTEEGELIVTLTVTTDEDCVSATAPQTLQIDFTELPGLIDDEKLGCLNGGVTLNPGGDPSYLYLWSPADGLSCTDCPSPHANPGQTTTYTVLVTNISADTCDIIREVTVEVPDDIGLVAGDDVLTCEPTANLNASSSLASSNFIWYLGGAQIGTGPSITVNVSGYSDYLIQAEDALGCLYFDTVQVAGGPADISTSGDVIICSDELENLSAQNLDANDTLVWQWVPTDAFTGSANVPDPDLIVTPGEQTIYVGAANQFGCLAEDSVYVAIIDVNNQLGFEPEVGCSGSVVSFTNTSQNAFGYLWDFGVPNISSDTSTLENPTYTYPDTGTYTVTLTLGFDVDCVVPAMENVDIVEPEFIPDFAYEFLDCDEDSVQVQFHDTSINFLNNTDSWLWTTSNGDLATVPDPIFWIYDGDELEVTLVIGTPNDCVDSVTKTLKLDFIEVNLSDTLVLCQGDSTELNPFGDTSYEYNWFPNTNISDPNIPNPMVWPSETTVYTVEITSFDIDTCSLVREVTVFVPEKIELTATDDTLTCGAQVPLAAQSTVSPTDFVWTNSNGQTVGSGPAINVLPSQDEIYQVLGTDQYGCQDSTLVAVANESIDISLDDPATDCPDVEIQLTATNNVADHDVDFDWTVTGDGQILPPANTPTVTVLTPPANAAATYTVTASNQFGCVDSLSQMITAYDFVPTVVDGIMACPDAPSELNPGANPDLTYSWSPPGGLSSTVEPNPTVINSQSATYSVTVSDVFGTDECSEVFEVEVEVAPIIDISETVDTFTCGEPIVISATTNVNTTLEWFDSQGISQGTGSTLEVNPDSMEIYTVVATDDFDCNATDTVVVFNRQIDLAVDGQGVIDTCPMPSYDLCVTNLDLSDILTYQWTGDTILAGANSNCVTVTTPIGVTSVFTVQVENQFGCTAEEELEVTTYEFNPILRMIEDICPNVPTELNTLAAGSDFTYSWMPQVGLSCYDCPNPIANLSTSQQYEVTVTGDFGAEICNLMQTVQVNVMPEIFLETTSAPDTSLCDPGSVTLSASVSSDIVESYLWSENPDLSNPIGSTSEITVTPDGAVIYYVQATDTLGCADTAQVTVNAFPVDANLPELINFCEEYGTITVSVTNNDTEQDLTYVWMPTANIIEYLDDSSSVVIDISVDTDFTVEIENQFGCTGSASTTVAYYDIDPTVGEITSTEDTIYFNSGEFSQLEINYIEGYLYDWLPQDGLDDPFIHNPIAEPEETTTYTVTVTDQGGCIAEREVTIVVLNPDCGEPYIFLPNAFSPNGDGENDDWFVRSNIIESMELEVYNRWGQRVFQSFDQNNGWDGTYKNERLTPDVFGFYLKAKCFNGEEFFKKGNVTILR